MASTTSLVPKFGPMSATLVTWAAAAGATSTYIDCQNLTYVSIGITCTVSSAGNSAAKVQGSNDGVSWVDITSATATLTGTGAFFLIRLGAIDYRYVQLVTGIPSAGTLTGSATVFGK